MSKMAPWPKRTIMTSQQLGNGFIRFSVTKIGGRVKETDQKIRKSKYPILLAPLNLTHFKKWRQTKNSQLTSSYLTGSCFIRFSVLKIGGEMVKSEYNWKETGFFYHILFVVKKWRQKWWNFQSELRTLWNRCSSLKLMPFNLASSN